MEKNDLSGATAAAKFTIATVSTCIAYTKSFFFVDRKFGSLISSLISTFYLINKMNVFVYFPVNLVKISKSVCENSNSS